jgi:ABC-type branched-subunit amino acid transport system ATPase component
LADVPSPALEVRGLAKSFGGLKALDGVDASVPSGQIVGLVGPNGSGKTTFLNVVTGFLPASAGEILFHGESIGGLRPEAIAAKGLARTFQEATIFPGATVAENVMAGMFMHSRLSWGGALLHTRRHRAEKRRLREGAHELLDRVGFRASPDTLAGDLGIGEQKHLGIAITVAAQPTLLMLDEPAAGMGEREVEGLVSLLTQLRDSGITVVLVEHNMDLVMSLSDHIVVLEFGVKISEGAPSVVRADERVIAAYLGRKGRANAQR